MSFADYTIMWHVYPLGFVGAPIRPEVTPPLTHSIKQVENWLDYLINMGANCLQLGPIFHAEMTRLITLLLTLDWALKMMLSTSSTCAETREFR